MGYKKDAMKGLSWIAVLRASTRAVAFLKTIILARLLVPQQFGAYGVALLVMGLLEVITETGVNIILVQEEDEESYVNSAWIVSIIRGTIISLIIIATAPLISNFFHSPESLVLLYMISIVPFLRGFINPSVVKFQKHLKFHLEFIYRFSIFVVDTVFAIAFTLITHSPVGIVIGLIAGVIWEVVFSYIIIKPWPALVFDRTYISKIFHRGKWITASGFFNYLFHNADNIAVGRILGTGSLGIYQMGYSLSILPITEISEIFSKVTFPVYTKISHDKKRLRQAFVKTTLIIAALSIPFGIIVCIFPTAIVSLTLGDKWIAAAAILPVLGIFAVIRTISGASSSLFFAVGKQEYVTVVTLVSAIGLLIPIIPLVLEYGVMGAAYSALIGSIVALPVMGYYVWKVFGVEVSK